MICTPRLWHGTSRIEPVLICIGSEVSFDLRKASRTLRTPCSSLVLWGLLDYVCEHALYGHASINRKNDGMT